MGRNVTIVVIILTLVVIAGYLVWLRAKYIEEVAPRLNRDTTIESSTISPSISSTPSISPTPLASASTSATRSSEGGKPKPASPSASVKASPKK